jgi:uncharacterized membrane protein
MEKEPKTELYVRIAKFFLPFILGIAGILTFQFILSNIGQGNAGGKLVILMFAYFVPPLGKETIIPAGVFGKNINIPFIEGQVIVPKIDPLVMASAIAFVDIIVALFLVWNYDLAKKIPLIGKFMIKVEKIGKSSSDKYGWIKPLRFIGVVLFVMVPFQGSGGLVGSIIGRLVGMRPWTIFVAISIGAIIGCILIAYFSEALILVFINNVLLGFLIVIILLFIIFMIFIWRKKRKNVQKT